MSGYERPPVKAKCTAEPALAHPWPPFACLRTLLEGANTSVLLQTLLAAPTHLVFFLIVVVRHLAAVGVHHVALQNGRQEQLWVRQAG